MNTDEHSWMLMGYTSNKTVGLSDESWDLTMNTVGVQPINTAVFFLRHWVAHTHCGQGMKYWKGVMSYQLYHWKHVHFVPYFSHG